jgi:transitional endoplasmic reticulum ATPase
MAQKQDEQTKQQELREAVLAELARLGGERAVSDTIAHQGTQIVLPATMETQDAIDFLVDYQDQQSTQTAFERTFRYRPWDGAAALQRALVKVFGVGGIGKATFSFFGRNPPSLIDIQIGFDQHMQVPSGRLAVPFFEGHIDIGAASHRELGPLFHLSVAAPRKYAAQIEGLFTVIEQELQTGSIYKGQAVDGQKDPEFLDLSTVDPQTVIYADDVVEQLEANIWSVLRHTDVLRRMKIPRKRAVLLEGDYGTGKTLAAFLTAQIAVQHGWTFIYCRPGRDNLRQVMGTARLYQPAIVFFEDVDTITESGDPEVLTKVLDMFDGITAKGTELMAVLTSNHPERIHKAMYRPGRLDALVHIGALDPHGVERMVKSLISADILDPDIDYAEVYSAMEGYLPAFVKEAVDRAARYAVAREGKEPEVLVTSDFVRAASGLRKQLERMQEATEGTQADALSSALRREMVAALDRSPILDSDDDHIYTLTTTENGVN